MQRDGAAQATLPVGEVPDHLLDEEGVALGLVVQRGQEAVVRGPAAERGDERAGLAHVEPSERELLQRAFAAQSGEQAGERLVGLRVAHRGHEQHPLRRGRPHEVADELERGVVGPVQIVEHHEQRRRAGDLGQQRGQRVEEPQAARVGLPGPQRLAADLGLGRRRSDLREDDPEIGGAPAEARGHGRERRAAGPPAQQLHDGLVGRRRVLVEAPVEHERTVGVGVVRELGREPRLADAGVAGEHDQAAGGGGGAAPAALEEGGLVGAADEGVAAPQRLQRRRPAARPRPDRRGAGNPSRAPDRGRAAAQHPLVHGHRGGPGGRAQLLAQEAAQVLEHAQRLGGVARGLVDLHQEPVRGLAERRGRHGGTRGVLRLAELARAQAGLGEHLERAHPQHLERRALVAHPRPVAVRQEGRGIGGQGLPGRSLRRPPGAVLQRGLGAARRARRLLDVDGQRAGGDEPDVGAPDERAGAEHAAELGQECAERRVGGRRRSLRPEQVDQFPARAGAVAIEREVGEHEPPLAAGRARVALPLGGLDGHRPAEPDGPA